MTGGARQLFYGPTLAFKDVALQLLGLLFERFLKGTDQHLTIVGGTSDDTGSVAIDAVAGARGHRHLRQHFADLGGTIECGELAAREEACGLLLPTAIFARWSR